MIWKILRPHFWMLDRRVRQTNRALVIGLIAALAFLLQWLWTNLLRDKLHDLPPEQIVGFIAQFMPMALLLLLMFALLGISDVIHQLYLASDMDLLTVAPIPQLSIFLAKMLQCSRATWIPSLILGAIFFSLGFVQSAALGFFLLIALVLLMGMVLATAATMILVMGLARILPARFARSWLPVAISMAVFVLMFGQQWLAQWFSTQAGFIVFLTEVPENLGQLALFVLGAAGTALLSGFVAYRVFDTAFHEGWDRLREVPVRSKPTTVRRRGVPRLARLLPQPLRSLLVKEWQELRRDPEGLLNIAIPILLVLGMVLLPIMVSGNARETLQPLLFWFLLMVIAIFGGMLSVGIGMMSVAREGRKMALLRSTPIPMGDMLKAKYWATWIPMASSWLVILIVSGVVLTLPGSQIGVLVGIAIWGMSGASLATLTIGSLKIDFEAEELKQRVPVIVSYLVMALNGVFMLLTIGAGIWLIIRLLPDSSVAFVVRMLSGSSAVGWLISEELWIPIALVGSQVAFWLGMKLLWNAAVRRLESWEGG